MNSTHKEALRSRALRQNNPEYNRQKNLKYRLKNRAKYLAHKAVERAVLIGKLQKQPCEVCETNVGVHAHHDDYSQQLTVRWLCTVHHRARHFWLELQSEPF